MLGASIGFWRNSEHYYLRQVIILCSQLIALFTLNLANIHVVFFDLLDSMFTIPWEWLESDHNPERSRMEDPVKPAAQIHFSPIVWSPPSALSGTALNSP